MQLVVLSPPEIHLPKEAAVVNALFDRGLQRYHLRKPLATIAQLADFLDQIQESHHNKVMLHQHHQLADQYQVQGIHYTEKQRPQAPLVRPAPHLKLSTSFHSVSQLEQNWGALDYAFLSPIFDSISKEGYKSAAFDEGQLATALQSSHLNIIALGGVEPSNVLVCQQLGFAGVAVIGSIWNAADPLVAFDRLQQTCSQADRG